MARISNKIVSNTGIQFASRIFQAVIGLVTVALLGRLLGPSDFGNYTLIINYAVFFGVLIDLGMEKVLITKLSQNRKRYFQNPEKISTSKLTETANILFGTGLVTRFGFSILLLIGVSAFVFFFTNYEDIVQISIILILLSICFDILRLGEAALKVKLKIWPISASLILKSFIIVMAAISLLFIKSNLLIWIVIGWVAGHSLSAMFVFIFFLKHTNQWHLHFNKKIAQRLVRESIPIGLGLVFGMMYFRVDTFMIHAIAGEEQTGFYGAAYKYIDIIITIPVFFVTAAWPVLAQRIVSDKKKFYRAFQRAFDFLNMISIPLTICLYILGSILIEITYGSDYQPAARIIQVLALIFPFIFLWNLYSTLLIILRKRYAYLIMTMMGTILNIGLNLYLISKYGSFGAAIATVITQIAVLGIVFVLLYRQLGYVPRFTKLIRTIYVGIIMALLLVGSEQLLRNVLGEGIIDKVIYFLVLSIISATTFIVSIFYFKIINLNDLKILLKKK